MAIAVLDHLEARAAAELGRIEHAATEEEAATVRREIRALLRRSLGLDRFPWPPDLKPRTIGSLQGEGYSVEKIIYESLPGTPVPVHLYVPGNLEGPAPAVIFYPGHWMEDSKTRPDFQAFCINMARLGFLVLTFDPFGQGERGVSWRDHRRTSSQLLYPPPEAPVIPIRLGSTSGRVKRYLIAHWVSYSAKPCWEIPTSRDEVRR